MPRIEGLDALHSNLTTLPIRLEKLRFNSSHFYDRAIRETAHFVAVPSLGGFVEGWTLVVPKGPLLNLSQLPEELRGEFECFVDDVRSLVEGRYGETSLFEHGPRMSGSLMGCGVDQAHLHIVPVSFEAAPSVAGERVEWSASDASLPSALGAEGGDYLWVMTRSGAYISRPDEATSQYFRRAIAQHIGLSDSWDYKRNPSLETVAQTYNSLAALADA